MTDKDIDFSDIPEFTKEMFSRGVVRVGLKRIERKVPLTVSVDPDVLRWYRSRGRAFQVQINALLRACMEASKPAASAK